MKWPRTTAIMAAALLSLAGCSNPVERGAPSSGDENPRGNTGDTPSSGESAEPGTPNGGSGDRFADYLPELGPSPTWHEGADFFDPCEDVPHHIYEQAGVLNPTPVDTMSVGHISCAVEGRADELGIDINPNTQLFIDTIDLAAGDWGVNSDRHFKTLSLEIGDLPAATAVVEETDSPLTCSIVLETKRGNVYFTALEPQLDRNQLCEKATALFINLSK